MSTTQLGEAIPMGTYSALESQAQETATAFRNNVDPADWAALARISWGLAMLPLVTWTAFVTTTWKHFGVELPPRDF